jgi:uncharacterized membrane protein
MKEKLLRKIRDKKVLIAIISLVMVYMANYGLYTKLGITEGLLKDTINVVLAILTLMGIVIDTPVLEDKKDEVK